MYDTVPNNIVKFKWNDTYILDLLHNAIGYELNYTWICDIQVGMLKPKKDVIAMRIILGIMAVLLITIVLLIGNHILNNITPILIGFIILLVIAALFSGGGFRMDMVPPDLDFVNLYAISGEILYEVQYCFANFKETKIEKMYLFDVAKLELLEQRLRIQTANAKWIIPTQHPEYLRSIIEKIQQKEA